MKKNIALVAGGDSGEYVISVNSAGVIRKNLDPEKYNVYLIIIKGAQWIYRNEQGNEQDVDKNDFTVMGPKGRVFFDCAVITIHGTPGEDGKLQGYFDMMRIPYTTSGQLACSLTFNKFFCNTLVRSWGVNVARSVKLRKGQDTSAESLLRSVTLPVFVKPNKGGSSLGTSFVKDVANLPSAIEACFEHDDEALIEEYIEGIELTCGVYRKEDEIKVLPVTQIVSKSEAKFFDYEAKYTKGAADEITPAPIPDPLVKQIQETTAFLYEKFELKGVSRIDYIFNGEKLFFLEANITPGMSERSIVPQQAAHIGISLQQLFTDLIEEALKV